MSDLSEGSEGKPMGEKNTNCKPNADELREVGTQLDTAFRMQSWPMVVSAMENIGDLARDLESKTLSLESDDWRRAHEGAKLRLTLLEANAEIARLIKANSWASVVLKSLLDDSGHLSTTETDRRIRTVINILDAESTEQESVGQGGDDDLG